MSTVTTRNEYCKNQKRVLKQPEMTTVTKQQQEMILLQQKKEL
jgi:hypothetical protein